MFFWAFIVYPILEIATFILVARATSWSTAVLITIATSAIGYFILHFQRSGGLFASRELSQRTLKNYLFSNLGALALLWPGFISDFFGVVLLVPPLRRGLAAILKLFKFDLNKNASGVFSVFNAYRFGDDGAFTPRYEQDDDADAGDEPIDVEPYDGNDDEPIDVEFTVK